MMENWNSGILKNWNNGENGEAGSKEKDAGRRGNNSAVVG